MDTRATIASILDRAYTARRTNDAAAAATVFAPDGQFGANGAPPATRLAERTNAIASMFENFRVVAYTEHCRIIDPPRAVVHWRGRFRLKNGREGETDVLDLIEIRDGKIAALTTFFDTAYASALGAPA
jgi:uncharacterized protein (TIGR02246 family)